MIISNKDYMAAQEKAMEEAKNSCNTTWVSNHQDGRTCPKDGVIHLKSVGDTTAKKMIDHRITTVETIMTNTPDKLSAMTEDKINASTFRSIYDKNKDNYNATKKSSDFVTRHKDQLNPYKSKYGREWQTAIRKTKHLRNKENIQNLVRACVQFGERHFAPDNKEWMICHNSLSMFVAAENCEWMSKEKVQDGWTYHDVFLFHKDGLNAGISGYGHHWVGNSLEFMPWECPLFRDLDVSLRYHVALTSKLADNDPRKFLLATPKQIDSAVHRLLDPQFQGEEGYPTAARVQGDIRKVLESNKQVVKAQGAIVKGIGDRSRK